MKYMRPHITVVFCLVFYLLFPSTAFAQEADAKERVCSIGHFTVSIPPAWGAFSADDKAAARAEFARELAPGLTQYAKAGEITPHLKAFEVYQKPSVGQLIAWTLVIPHQTDFKKEILQREDVQFNQRKSLSGGRVKGGSCRLVDVGGFKIVRVDIEMANGGRSTNFHYWSPKSPGVVTILMVGVRADGSAHTQKEFTGIVSSLVVSDNLKQ